MPIGVLSSYVISNGIANIVIFVENFKRKRKF